MLVPQQRSRVRVVFASLVTAALTLLGLSLSSSVAFAAEVQPTASNIKLTDLAGNEIDTVSNDQSYRVVFDFAVPDAVQPGDTFTVTLPNGFVTAMNETIQLGEVATVEHTREASRIHQTLR